MTKIEIFNLQYVFHIIFKEKLPKMSSTPSTLPLLRFGPIWLDPNDNVEVASQSTTDLVMILKHIIIQQDQEFGPHQFVIIYKELEARRLLAKQQEELLILFSYLMV